ncbi:MAG: hypothetical protein QXI32_01525 [Candidatus Bathyarchaeia archaeon]
MSDLERVATIDFVISVLKEHEKALDSIGHQLKNELRNLRQVKKQARFIFFSCISWDDFKEVSQRAEAVSFRINTKTRIRALKGNYVYEFNEPQTDQPTEGWILPHNPAKLRDLLAQELHIPKKKVIQGELFVFPQVLG